MDSALEFNYRNLVAAILRQALEDALSVETGEEATASLESLELGSRRSNRRRWDRARYASRRLCLAEEARAWLTSPDGVALASLLGYGDWMVRKLLARGMPAQRPRKILKKYRGPASLSG